jgi:hypothetical protein
MVAVKDFVPRGVHHVGRGTSSAAPTRNAATPGEILPWIDRLHHTHPAELLHAASRFTLGGTMTHEAKAFDLARRSAVGSCAVVEPAVVEQAKVSHGRLSARVAIWLAATIDADDHL